MNLNNFDWGWMDQPVTSEVNGQTIFHWHIHDDGRYQSLGEYHKEGIIKEIFTNRCYEKYFQVEEGDVVVDIGASIGPFTYSILEKKPKHVFCLEPSEKEFKILVKNTMGYQVTQINKGISYRNAVVDSDMMFGGEKQMESLTFQKFVKLFGLEKIDFLKTDCEGGEYDIFNFENLDYLINNVKKISGEWHLSTPEEKLKFRNFRDNILVKFQNYEINSIDGCDIKWDLWNEHLIEYYNQILIYIHN